MVAVVSWAHAPLVNVMSLRKNVAIGPIQKDLPMEDAMSSSVLNMAISRHLTRNRKKLKIKRKLQRHKNQREVKAKTPA